MFHGRQLWQQPGMNCDPGSRCSTNSYLVWLNCVHVWSRMGKCKKLPQQIVHIDIYCSSLKRDFFAQEVVLCYLYINRSYEPSMGFVSKSYLMPQHCIVLLQNIKIWLCFVAKIWIPCWEPKKMAYLRCVPTPHFNEPWIINYEGGKRNNDIWTLQSEQNILRAQYV